MTTDFGKTSAAVDALFDEHGARELGGPNDFQAHTLSADSPLLQEAIDLMAAGEGGTSTTAPDPMLDWAYAPRDAEGTAGNGKVFGPLGSDGDEKRETWFKWVVTYTSLFATNRKGFYALTANSEADGKRVVVAAAMTAPPGTVPFSTDNGEMEAACGLAGFELAEEIMQGERIGALGEWQATTAASNGDKLGEKYLKVEVFATSPSWQGKGCGSALVKLLGEVADADGVPAYLETAGASNVAFYAKKGGYEEVARSPCADFTHEGGAVAMLRGGKNPPQFSETAEAKKEEPKGEEQKQETPPGEEAKQQEAEAEVKLTPWDVAVKAVGSLTINDLTEITAFQQAPPGAQEILDAFYNLCGVDGGFTKENRTKLQEEGSDLYFAQFGKIQKDILGGNMVAQVTTYLHETLPQLEAEVKLDESDSIGTVVGLVAGFLLLIPEYCGNQVPAKTAPAPTEEAGENQEAEENQGAPADDEENAEAAGDSSGGGPPADGGDPDHVTSDDVAYEYGEHYFTRADVVDVTKIQASYRRKAAGRRVQEAKSRRAQLKDEEQARRLARVNRIPLPDDTEVMLPATVAANAAAEEKKAAAAGSKARVGFTVDYSKPLNRKDMSADTKGMQRMYSRMLKTKMWW